MVAFGLWCFTGVTIVLLCCFASTIKNVIAVMKATSQFLEDVPSQMVQPVIVGIVQFCVLAMWAPIFIEVASIGVEEGDEKKCLAIGDFYCLEWSTTNQQYGLVFLLFMLYWVVNFLHALSHFGTSYAMNAWYFSSADVMTGRKKPLLG